MRGEGVPKTIGVAVPLLPPPLAFRGEEGVANGENDAKGVSVDAPCLTPPPLPSLFPLEAVGATGVEETLPSPGVALRVGAWGVGVME